MTSLFQFNFWSFAVPAAIVSGFWLGLRRARQAGLDDRLWESATQWAVGMGLVVSHAVEILFYQPQRLKAEGWLTLLKFWDGLSSYGGFAGAVVTLFVFYGIRRRRWWREADVLIQALFMGWIFGRLGCTVAGDHPGPRTTSFLAYPYPPPGYYPAPPYYRAYPPCVRVWTSGYYDAYGNWVFGYYRYDCNHYGYYDAGRLQAV